jgi:hypothetical protein
MGELILVGYRRPRSLTPRFNGVLRTPTRTPQNRFNGFSEPLGSGKPPPCVAVIPLAVL